MASRLNQSAATSEEPVIIDVVTEIVIDCPVEVVATYAADPSNAPQWYANIDSVEWKTDTPVEVGSAMTFVARFLGRRLEYTYVQRFSLSRALTRCLGATVR